MASIAAERPLLLVVDDLQWAEPSTLLLLGHLVRRAVPGSALVATLRRGQPGRGAVDVLGDPGTDRSVELIDLGGLDRGRGRRVARTALWCRTARRRVGRVSPVHGWQPVLPCCAPRPPRGRRFVRSPSGDWVAAAELEVVGVPEGARGVIARRLAGLDLGRAVCWMRVPSRACGSIRGSSPLRFTSILTRRSTPSTQQCAPICCARKEVGTTCSPTPWCAKRSLTIFSSTPRFSPLAHRRAARASRTGAAGRDC